MVFFKRKGVERPKNPLGYALYKYDNIINRDLKKIISRIDLKKRIDFKKANIILENAFYKLDLILEDISKDNLKVDYRSDKTRDLIIDMIKKLKDFFNKAKEYNYRLEKIESIEKSTSLNDILNIREEIKKKMKDIESDYL